MTASMPSSATPRWVVLSTTTLNSAAQCRERRSKVKYQPAKPPKESDHLPDGGRQRRTTAARPSGTPEAAGGEPGIVATKSASTMTAHESGMSVLPAS